MRLLNPTFNVALRSYIISWYQNI